MTEQTDAAEVEALETEVVETLDPNGYGWAAGDGPGMASILRTVLASDWLAAREAAAEVRGAQAMLAAVEKVASEVARVDALTPAFKAGMTHALTAARAAAAAAGGGGEG